ncbi:MAG: PadR-like family transcriptional regulator [Clostridia bacterium]|nr:PadR-like family transcriptional regulator [Clostridia bacterium]
MARINKTYFAIMGLLAIKPMSAYELVKFSKESIGLFWNESYGHIHKSLQYLEKVGSVFVLEETTNGRLKKVYGVTQLGRDRFHEWISQKPEEAVMRNELLMKIFVCDERHIPMLIEYVQEEETECKGLIDILAGIENEIDKLPIETSQKQLWVLTLDYGYRSIDFHNSFGGWNLSTAFMD